MADNVHTLSALVPALRGAHSTAPVFGYARAGISAIPVPQPAGAAQAAVTLGNTDGEIAGLTISDPPTQAEVRALCDKCEELADDVRAFSA